MIGGEGSGLNYHFYLLDSYALDLDSQSRSDSEYSISIWQPGNDMFSLPNVSPVILVAWQLCHYAGIFKNKELSIFMIHYKSVAIHRSVIYPKYFRYPFMNNSDLQIGNTWTHPDHRGKGLASFAINYIVRKLGKPGRRFWYVVDKNNASSIRVIEKCHFNKYGEGIRTKRCNTLLLGSFVIVKYYQ